ncbi:MAG: gliding motility-associated C-terminal domain-containing protein [Bacteroidia bacterium]|nr:gliding motility-associated C-terminal domain-containing protein [Bacteroidia bacterium]
MKKKLFLSLSFLVITYTQVLVAQTKEIKKHDPNVFDEKAAINTAKAKGIKASEINGYVEFLKNDFSSKKALKKQGHIHSPYEAAGTPGESETVIYLEPNKPMSLGCPNMGFEQYNFNGWSGGSGTTSTGGTVPNYGVAGTAILNGAGNNVSVLNTTNYHTIMSLPPVNPIYQVIDGYDSLACKAVGSQTISQIPFVSPFSFDPVSVRMNGSVANARACRLKYITTSSSINQRLSFSYAVVLQNPSGHSAGESPYFKVEIRNETTGAILPGCTSYTFNPKSTLASDSLFQSAIGSTFDPTFYRKWQYYSVDLSTLPLGTNVSINFEVGGCSLSGHWGYAYVDAECGGLGTPYANWCSGTSYATLVAPTGFNSYQWTGPGGLISGAVNDTLQVATPVAGSTYTVSMISPGGCVLSQTVTIPPNTIVNIINLNSTSSCANGNSGTAYVQANGSNGIYTYQWTSTSGSTNGNIVSTSQTATGLSPGTYSVLVSSTTCGQASANLSVGVSPPFFISQNKPFCGNSTSIALPGGSNYTWYQGTTLIPAPIGTNDTLYITPAVDGDIYSVVYENPQGCRDSIKYTLGLVAGGNAYFSNTTNVCPNDVNGSTLLNLTTPFSAPYSYNITGPTAANTVTNTTTSTTTIALAPLAPGTYTAIITDGVCIYNNTVTIGVIQTNFTITPTNTVLCFPDAVTLNLDFGEVAPSSCGLSSSGSCSTPNSVQIGNGTLVNSSTGYPAIYGNFFRNTRHQILYKASELLAAGVQAGKISSIAFNVTTINGITAYPDFTIKMKCTTAADLTSTTFDNTGLIQVYYAPTANITSGWNTYNFPNAYEWDGVSNILIDVCNSITNPSWTNNSSMPYTLTTFPSVRYYISDGIVACMTTNVATTSSNRPNVKFGNCGATNPASYTVSVSPNGTITANFDNDSIRVAPTFSAPPLAGNVTYTISVINPVGGCVATKTVAVLFPPLATIITAAVTNTTLCEGDNTSMSALGAFNYNWSYLQGGSLIPISTATAITVVPPIVGINTYVVTGYAPCPSSTPDTKTITVNVTPKANLLVTPLPDVTKCLNKPFTFNTAAGSSILPPGNQGTPYTYSWTTLPGNIPAVGATNSSSYTTNSNSTTTLVVTVSGICAYPISDTVVVNNFVNNLTAAISNSIVVCPNTPFTFNSIVNGGYPSYNYVWTLNSATVSTIADYINNAPASGGNYNVGLTVTDSCGYQNTASNVIVVLPNTLNVAIIDSVALCGNTPFTLNASVTGGYPNFTYNWYNYPSSNSISNTTVLNSITPEFEGAYPIAITVTDSCGYEQTDIQLITVLPPCQVVIPNVITPNGDNANEFFVIKNIEYHPNTIVTIYDRWGKKIYENPNYKNEWKAEGVSDGTFFYIVEVPDDKKYNGFVTVFKGK